MNLTMVRSGSEVFIHAELIKGRSFIAAAARAQSAHFLNIAAVSGSSFASMGSMS